MESPQYKSARLLYVHPETEDVGTYRFVLESEPEFLFQPGQFNMIGLPGVEEAPLSMSSIAVPGENSFAHTIRRVGNVTGWVANLRAGEKIMLRGPFGRAWPMEELGGRDVLLIAGGVGMAPMRSLLLHCLKHREGINRLILVYGARNPAEMLFRKELLAWQGLDTVETVYCVDRIEGRTPYASLNLRSGLVTDFLEELDLSPSSAVACICGPELMMRFAARRLMLAGYLGNRVYVSMERRMRCGTAHCGHCQIGAKFVCQDGPVFAYADISRFVDTML